MPYSLPHYDITWQFSIVGTDEVAYTGLSVTAATAPDPSTAPDAALDDLIGAMGTLMGTSALHWASYSELVGVKLARVGTDGKYLVDPVERVGAVTGTAIDVPPQCTIVLSFWSGRHLGKGNYGRMYLPHTRFALASGAFVGSEANAVDIATAGATFLTNVETALNDWLPTAQVRILGQTGAGTNFEVAQVRVGRVTDTQRRRREQLDEGYVSHAR